MNPIHFSPTKNAIPPFLENVKKTDQHIDRLSRLIEISSIPDIARKRLLPQLVSTWQSSLEEPSRETLRENLQKIAGSGPYAKHYQPLIQGYLAAIDEADTTEKLRKCVRRFWKDARSATLSSLPLVRSKQGENGPTFLVSFSRLNKTGEGKLHNSVIKWTTQSELSGNQVFRAFSHSLLERGHPVFCVANASGFDFTAGIHEGPGAMRHPLTQDQQKTMESLKKMIKLKAPDKTSSGKLVMVMDRVQGENLIDFGRTKYQHLSTEEKRELFRGFGEVTMLDILTGNLDRLFRADYDAEGKYFVADYEANLGNLLVHWIQGKAKAPLLYTIDNDMDAHLTQNQDHRQSYNALLKDLFSNPELHTQLINNIVKSFTTALERAKEEEAKSPEEKDQLNKFKADIEAFGKECFSVGLKAMTFKLQETIIPRWNQDDHLKQYLTETQPLLLEAIQERFNLFITKELL